MTPWHQVSISQLCRKLPLWRYDVIWYTFDQIFGPKPSTLGKSWARQNSNIFHWNWSPSSRHVSSLSFIHKTSRILVSSQPLLLGNGPDGAPFPTSQPTHPAAHGSTMIQRLYCMASCWRSVASLLRWCWLIALVITCKAPYIWRLHKWRDLHLQPYSFLWERVAWHEEVPSCLHPPVVPIGEETSKSSRGLD